eukprot:3021261-Amphidinium_carterae.1
MHKSWVLAPQWLAWVEWTPADHLLGGLVHGSLQVLGRVGGENSLEQLRILHSQDTYGMLLPANQYTAYTRAEQRPPT